MIRTAISLILALGTLPLALPALAQDCSATTPGTEMLADYPAVRAFYDSLSSGNPALVDCAVAPEWTNTPSAPGTPAGPEGFKPAVAGLAGLFSQYTFKTEDVVASGNKVVVRSTVTAVQSGEFLGLPPAETPVTFQTIDIHQLGEDGKLAQSWHVEDWLTYLLTRGALPLAPAAAAK